MSSIKNSLILIALFAMVGCGSRPKVVHKPPEMPPLPPQIATKVQPNLSERLLGLLQKSSQTETGQSSNSTPVSTPTTKSEKK